ncbi:MAG TPA: hypothetical protein DCK79_08100 [Candidatus Atribacteria bacterium]|nr:hypothetical protein [Candidatus Atribacteria bacterium]
MKAINVAKYFLYKANQDGDLITNLKMQKLLYYAQAWYLVNFDKPLFEDQIFAWDFGPVVKNVYDKYKKYRYTPIILEENFERNIKKIDKEDKKYLDEFYDQFINYSAHDLVDLSHREAPWKKSYKTRTQIIGIDLMKDFYTKLYGQSIKK